MYSYALKAHFHILNNFLLLNNKHLFVNMSDKVPAAEATIQNRNKKLLTQTNVE